MHLLVVSAGFFALPHKDSSARKRAIGMTSFLYRGSLAAHAPPPRAGEANEPWSAVQPAEGVSCATLLLNERVPVISVQMLLGHQHVDTTMHYARLYDGTVAADYFKAMDRIESLTTIPALEEEHAFSPGELISILADLKHSPLNPEQITMVSAIQEGIYALVNREHYVP